MLKNWLTDKLSDLGNIVTGTTPSSNLSNMWEGNIQFITPADFHNYNNKTVRTLTNIGAKNSRMVKENSTLVTCIGNIGNVIQTSEKVCFNQQINGIEWNIKVNEKFGYYIMKYIQPILESKASKAVMSILNKTNFSNIEVPYPKSLDEQQEIVDILDKAQEMVRLRKKAVELTEKIIPAIFYEMFGDPVIENNKELKNVADLVNNGIIEKPLDGNHGEIHPKAKDFVKDGVPFIAASDLEQGEINFTKSNYITETQAKSLRKGFAKQNDVLLSHKGTIGRTAIIQKNNYPYIVLTPQLTYYRIKNTDRLSNVYLKYFFDSYGFQSTFQSRAGKGATRAYLGITEQLDLPVFVPEKKIQSKFVGIAQHFEELKIEQLKAVKFAEDQFQSLLQAAFEGKLTAHKYGNK